MKFLCYLPGVGLLPLALMVIASYIPGFWVSSFLAGMRLHLGVALVALAAFCLLIQRLPVYWVALCIGIATLAHFFYLTSSNAYQPSAEIVKDRPWFRVISFNLQAGNQQGRKILDLFEKLDASVVITQESSPLIYHLGRVKALFPYRVGCGELIQHCDLMIMSRYPIRNPEVVTLGDYFSERFIKAEIEVEGTVVQLVAMHLTKPFYGPIHQQELARAAEALGDTTKPVLLAGDFNSSILANDVQHFMRTFELKTAKREPNTWPIKRTFLGLPIDHIMTSSPLAIKRLGRLSSSFGSNHYGLVADIVLMKEEGNLQ